MGINKATAIKLKKQVSLAVAEMNYKSVVDESLRVKKMYRLVNMVTGEEHPDLMTFDEVLQLPLRNLYEMKLVR